MKSIKEIANEVFDNPFKQGCFEAGANYVLDKIEEFMKHNLIHSGNLKRLIEQLKK